MRSILACVAAGVTVVAACSSSTPGAGAGGGGPVQEAAEAEPNDGPDFSGMQQLGSISGTKTIRLKGKLSSGGNDGQSYTGDKDVFAFEIASAGGKLTVKVDWSGSADVDAVLYDANLNPVAADNTTAKPIAPAGQAIAAGKYALGLFSKDQAADWTADLVYEASAGGGDGGGGGGGETCGANLYNGWWGRDPCGGSCEQYQFSQDGTFKYESFNAVSGTIPGSGTFSIACPNISISHSDGSKTSFTVQNGVLYEKGSYKFARCSGKCF
jgi:hypothetical protein